MCCVILSVFTHRPVIWVDSEVPEGRVGLCCSECPQWKRLPCVEHRLRPPLLSMLLSGYVPAMLYLPSLGTGTLLYSVGPSPISWHFVSFSIASSLQNPRQFLATSFFFFPLFSSNLLMYLPYFPPVFLLGCVQNWGSQGFSLGKSRWILVQ